MADREQMDDAWALMDKLSDALDELDEVICGNPRRKVSAAAAAR